MRSQKKVIFNRMKDECKNLNTHWKEGRYTQRMDYIVQQRVILMDYIIRPQVMHTV